MNSEKEIEFIKSDLKIFQQKLVELMNLLYSQGNELENKINCKEDNKWIKENKERFYEELIKQRMERLFEKMVEIENKVIHLENRILCTLQENNLETTHFEMVRLNAFKVQK